MLIALVKAIHQQCFRHPLHTAVHLCEADGEDGVGAAAEVIHASSGCGAVLVAKIDQVLHVIVVMYQVLGQIYTEFSITICHISYKLI